MIREKMLRDAASFFKADKSDVMKTVNTISAICAVIGLALLLAALAIGMVVTRMITRPIAALTAVINDISELTVAGHINAKTQLTADARQKRLWN